MLSDSEWRTIGRGKYQIKVADSWYDVPPEAVLHDIPQCGLEPDKTKRPMAKVWYAPTRLANKIVDIHVFCFLAGTLY